MNREVQSGSTPGSAPEEDTNNEHYRALLDLRGQLAKQIKTLSSASLASAKQAGEELADVGSDDFMRETELTLMNEEGQRLASIQAALRRFENGTYGRCTDCEKAISQGRLLAKPYASLCIDCKSEREANSGHAMSNRARVRRAVKR